MTDQLTSQSQIVTAIKLKSSLESKYECL